MKEKKLTPAEKKKREEIAKAIEKDNPDMPMAKKMAIATATAKRVAEYGGPPISRKKYLKQKPMDKELEEKMDEGKMKGAMMRRQDMAKLAGLYSKAMKAIPGSPKQKALKKQIDQYRRELGMKESVNESVYKFLVVNTKTGEIESAGSTLDGRNGAKETKKEIERKGKKMQILQLKKKVSDRQMERMLGYTLKQSGIEVGKNATVVEAVSPAQQAAIAISKKERGEKPKNECASEDDFKPHMMYDPKTGKGVKANTYADHVKYDKMGYTHEKPEIKEGKYKVNIKGEGGATVQARSEKEAIAKVMKQLGIANRFAKDRSFMKKISVLGESVEESRAYRDAMRGLRSKSATRGMATTKKDKDTEASDDDRKAASKNIIMQLRKAADLSTGAEVEFERGKGKVSRAQAQGALARFNALAKPRDKEAFQRSIRSLSDIKKILGR